MQTSSECSRQALSSKDKGYIVSMDWLRVVGNKTRLYIAQGAVCLRRATYKSRMTENGGRTVPTQSGDIPPTRAECKNMALRTGYPQGLWL